MRAPFSANIFFLLLAKMLVVLLCWRRWKKCWMHFGKGRKVKCTLDILLCFLFFFCILCFTTFHRSVPVSIPLEKDIREKGDALDDLFYIYREVKVQLNWIYTFLQSSPLYTARLDVDCFLAYVLPVITLITWNKKYLFYRCLAN